MVENIAGNAQGYQLSLKNYPEKVPVSRAYISHFNKANSLVLSAIWRAFFELNVLVEDYLRALAAENNDRQKISPKLKKIKVL